MTRPTPLNVLSFGAKPDGETLNTEAFRAALRAAADAGGGTVVVPAGAYVTGSLALLSNVTLHLEAGARLQGSLDPKDYPLIPDPWSGEGKQRHAPLIGGADVVNVALTGRGTVDGRGKVWWDRVRRGDLEHRRPQLVQFLNCRDVLIEGLTFVNSPNWTLNPTCCDNVTIRGVTLRNPYESPNTDGINPDGCADVHISDCHIDVGDDCVTIKSGTRDRAVPRKACECVTITNCTMIHGHGGVVIGSEMSGDVRDVAISNCVFAGTDRGLRIKSRRGRGGVVEDVRATNIVMRGVLCPFVVNLFYDAGSAKGGPADPTAPAPVDEGTPAFRNLTFSHITSRDTTCAAGVVYGLPERWVEGITFDDVVVTLAEETVEEHPAMAAALGTMRGEGFLLSNVRNVRMRDVEVRPRRGPALRVENAEDVDIEGLRSPAPADDASVIQLRDASEVFIRGCRAREGTGAFLDVSGPASRAITLGPNDLRAAAQAARLAATAPADALSRV